MKYLHALLHYSIKILLLGLIALAPAYAVNGEDIFKQAQAYTLQIRTVV